MPIKFQFFIENYIVLPSIYMDRNRLQYDDGVLLISLPCLYFTLLNIKFFGDNLLLNVYMYQPELFVGEAVPVDSWTLVSYNDVRIFSASLTVTRSFENRNLII